MTVPARSGPSTESEPSPAPDRRDLADVVDQLTAAERIAAELIALPSVNPMGVPAPRETPYFEARTSRYLADWFSGQGWEAERTEVALGRHNVWGRLPASPGRPLVVLEAHQDTVPTEGMTIEPFRPQLSAERLYGRGACDVKGPLGAMLATGLRLQELPVAERPVELVIACTVDEEFGFLGAPAMAAQLRQRFAFPPAAVVVAEPTELNVVVAHKGVLRWRWKTQGRAAHSSTPDLGRNAIYASAALVGWLAERAGELARGPAHPRLGPASLSVGRIQGGASVNIVPDACEIEVDRRLLPDEDPEAVFAAVQREAQAVVPDLQAAEPYLAVGGLSDRDNGAIAQQLARCVEACGAPSDLIAVPFGTNAPVYSDWGPTVVFGPGSIAQAHTADEWICRRQLNQAVEILLAFLHRIGEPRGAASSTGED